LKKTLVLLAFISSALVCYSQINENFSDGDFTNNPSWLPDDPNNWTVVSEQLRSNSAIASSSFYISTASAKAINTQWEFFIQLQFNTSSVNYVDVYLISEEQDLSSTNNNAYYVRIGGTSDEISLYKMNNGVSTIIINGTDGVTNRSNNPLRIKVVRDASNNWSLQRDLNGGTDYVPEGIAFDNTITTSNYFGFRIVQSTSSFFNKHFFDDIYVGNISVEKIPPVLQSIQVISQTQLLLTFNEELDEESSQSLLNYFGSNSLGNPATAQLQIDKKSVLLTFDKEFQSGISNQLGVTGVKDIVGNVMADVSLPFLFFQPSPVSKKDIILTEIFSDPSPQVGLPEAEFVELYNRSPNPIDIAGWKFTDRSSTATFSSHIIQPGEYWIITSNSSATLFTAYGNTIGVSNFPTLNNSGDALILKDVNGVTIDSVNYTPDWFKDDDKKEGGWTLELIDLNNTCGEEENWIASENPSGGSPGKINSVNANKPDNIGPKLLSVVVTSVNQLQLTFSEKLQESISNGSFTITPEVDIINVSYTSTSLKEILITLFQDLEVKQLYSIRVDVRDCNGNEIQEEFSKLNFAVPEKAELGDILINEILFNPRPGGVDFVEVVNVSSKYINLKNWWLANYQDEEAVNLKLITTNDLLISPGKYIGFTIDKAILRNQYPNSIEDNLVTSQMPSLNDDEGSIAILSDEKLVIDHFSYLDDYHTPLLKDKEGVSLERISFYQLTNNPENWRSASSVIGYATPGYINSNSRPENSLDENAVIIEPEIFSLQVPGQDFAKINYKFSQGGQAANVKIIDHQGRIIRQVANNETLGNEGFFRWDGDRDDGSKARMGYYFVWFEVFDLSGKIKTYRKRVVIGR
jgi:hypothetical protein